MARIFIVSPFLLLSAEEEVFVLVGDVLPAVRVGDALFGLVAQRVDLVRIHGVGPVDQAGQVAGLLGPVQGGVPSDLAVEAHAQQQVQIRGRQRLQQARVRAAHLVPVEVRVRILADLHQKLPVVHGAHELDARVPVEVRLLLQLLEELVAHVRHQREVPLRVARHELADHGLVVVLRHEPAHHQVVRLRFQTLRPEPVQELRVVVRQTAPPALRSVGDERCLRTVPRVLLADVLLHVYRIAHHQVSVLRHHPLGHLPVPAHRRAPLRAHPLVPVRVHVQFAAQTVDRAREMRRERADAARQHVHDWMRDTVAANIRHTIRQRRHVIPDCLRRSDLRHPYPETTRVMVRELTRLRQRLARYVVSQPRLTLVVLSQTINERLITAVTARNPLRPHNEHMLNSRHPTHAITPTKLI